ncbi:MCM2/3/5 family-domain-containing protein [Gaertneriomyces semiglobifer]|nr:MCM2/3/5 family-domain-containing protein [Gaertneriomyces semiglobifer]
MNSHSRDRRGNDGVSSNGDRGPSNRGKRKRGSERPQPNHRDPVLHDAPVRNDAASTASVFPALTGPFHYWTTYFPEEVYIPSHTLVPLLNTLISYFEQHVFTQDAINHDQELCAVVQGRRNAIPVDYVDLVAHTAAGDIRVEQMLYETPELLLTSIAMAATEVIEKIRPEASLSRTPHGPSTKTKRIARINNCTNVLPFKDLKANLMGNFVATRGTVVRVSSIRPIINRMNFLCNACGEGRSIVLNDGQYKVPTKCARPGCKSRNFTVDKGPETSTSIDWQRIRLQEKLADNQIDSGRIPRTLEVELTEDLVDTVVPGDVVVVSGIVKVLATEEDAGQSRVNQMYSMYVAANSITKASTNAAATDDQVDGTKTAKTFTKDAVSFSKKELYGIQQIWDSPDVFRLLVNSLCPSIFGHEMVKAGLLLTLFGGRKRDSSSSMSIRSDPHVLVVGDPGLGKSQMLSAVCKVAPRGVYVCGNATTTSGLTVTMVKDAETGETALEAGALVLGDQGVCCIDEFDKMSEYQALLEAMEQQSISIAKAGIVCTLPARTSIIAAANPVGGHYNKAKTVSENLRMNSALLSRFDLVFILLDRPDEEMDLFLSEHIMKLHSGVKGEEGKIQKYASNHALPADDSIQPLLERLRVSKEDQTDPIPLALLRKYIAYAKRYVQPRLSREAAEVLQKFYLTLRSKYRSIDATPITTRQLESMIRLGEARARTELRDEVSVQDARDVVEIMKYSLWDSYEDEAGALDFQRSQHGTGMSKKGEPKRFVAHIHKVAQHTGNNRFTYENLYQMAQEIQLNFSNFGDMLETLNNQGGTQLEDILLVFVVFTFL